jgi:hypothetical protein
MHNQKNYEHNACNDNGKVFRKVKIHFFTPTFGVIEGVAAANRAAPVNCFHAESFTTGDIALSC